MRRIIRCNVLTLVDVEMFQDTENPNNMIECAITGSFDSVLANSVRNKSLFDRFGSYRFASFYFG